MIGIVWGNSQQIANKKLEKIRKDYLSGHFNIVRVRKDFFEEVRNGLIAHATSAYPYQATHYYE